MKKLVLIGLVAVGGSSLLGAQPQRLYLPRTGTQSKNECANALCNNPAPLKKKYCPSCQKEIDRKEKEQREEVKELYRQVADRKYEKPTGARIGELCGYELGSVLKLPCTFQISEKGNVIVKAKLNRPFRRCTEVELYYSSKTLALSEIRLFSKELKGMSEAEVKAEIEGMKGVLAEKFKTEIRGWNINSAVFTNPGANQYLEVSYEGHDVKKVSLEKENKMERVWTVSVTLSDWYFWKLELDGSKPPVDTRSGLDAL